VKISRGTVFGYSVSVTETQYPTSEVLLALSRKLRTALSLYQSGIVMKRAQLRREDPAASEQEIAARLSAWLRTRPGAPFGDAEGVGTATEDPL
jgi:hypothetical protein